MKWSFTDMFIKKPVLAVVINLIILAVGWRTISSLPIRQYPRMESSSIVITTAYIGASAETVRGFITTPIERAVSAIDGIDYIESTSTAGISTITIHLRLNHDSNDALAEVSARINQVRSDLPQESEAPSIQITRTDKPYATFYVSFTSDTMTLNQLNDYLVREVQPELQSVAGVQRCGVEGARELAMRIWLNPERMDALDVSADEVYSALSRNNFLAAVGRTKSRDVQVDLLTDTDLHTPQDFERLIIREVEGTIIRLSDIARVELSSEEPTGQAGFNGTPAIYLSIWPLPRANELDVAAALRERMDVIRPTLPGGVRMDLAYDGTYYMENAIKEITRTLAETIGIVALVVFLFMGSIRSVIVPLVAMPISLVGACIAAYLMGFSLNLLTILAIVLSVGLVVDDAIVMVENVERHIREGKPRIEAALIGARELFAPVVSMTITLAAVYTPIGFQSGLTGMLFKEFAFTLAAAVVVSGVVAITLSPIMSAYMVPQNEGLFARHINRQFDRLRRLYGSLLNTTLQLRWTMALAAVLIAVGAVPMYAMSRKELAPTEDEGIVFTFVLTPPDATLDYINRSFEGIKDAFLGLPEGEMFFQVANLGAGFGGFGGVKVKQWHERERTTKDMQAELFPKLGMLSGPRAVAGLPAPLPGAGQYDVELVVTASAEAEEMAPIAGQLVGAAFGSGKFLFADTDLKIDLPQTRLVIDREKVADMGVDLTTVGREFAVLLSGGYVNRFNYEGRSYKVIPQVDEQFKQSPDQLLKLKLRTASGGLVLASSAVSLKQETAPRSLNRFQQRNSFKVQGIAAPGATKEEALTALETAAKGILPSGYTIDYAGESRQMRTEGSSLAVTLGFALGLIYLVLAAQFSSFRDPLIVLLGSVPLAITGALVFAFMDFTTINIYSQVGLITLVGLVAKNGILIVEFANHLQEQGKSKSEAVKEAAVTRLRPILMTSAATVFGHFPLVLVTGAGAEARNSIGVILVAGMAISTAFTLFVVPSIYVLLAAKRTPLHGDPSHVRGMDEPTAAHANGVASHGVVPA
ncbi:MAG TPA: efflux RND transporter permease subunit [Phycisphaerales bacterium]|nr:efflux RND transporter permease subunit [Phycisphaerales bacterium]